MGHFRKPKIAIISIRNSYNYGGVLSSLKVAYQFCEQYFEPKVFFLSFDKDISTSLRSLKFLSSNKPFYYFGMNCIEIGSRWAFWEPGHYSFTLPMWQELLKEYDYFWVVSGTCIAAHPLIQLNKKFAMWIGTPYDEDRAERVKRLTGIRYLLNKLAQPQMHHIEKSILQKCNYTWAISTYAKSSFESIIGTPQYPIVHCGYPIDCASVQLPISANGEIAIMAVGRFSDPRKNINMLIRVFDKLYPLIPRLKLYVVGKKPTDEELAPYRTLDSFEHISFTGQISSDDLNALYNRAQLMLITSYQEGLGIVGLEALLHGIPVIATDCGGTKDYVVDNVTGYLVKINDDNAMVAKALAILSSQELHKQLSIGGRQMIANHFSENQIHGQFKTGFKHIYPALENWFDECDQRKKLKERRNNIHYSQDIV
jgi:glycosyltransferase involved in cell wall biosynthesis